MERAEPPGCSAAAAAFGAVQVGQLAALRDAGRRADFIVGVSVGALNGAIAAVGSGTGEPVLFDSGPLAPALLASTALPYPLPAVRAQGRLLLDGGAARISAVETAVARGAGHLVTPCASWPHPTNRHGQPHRSGGGLRAERLLLLLHSLLDLRHADLADRLTH
jgi:predicted acylesterase/phospholipase RssA